MNVLPNQDAGVARALRRYVVAPKGQRPLLSITASSGSNHHLVTINPQTILYREENGELMFVSFTGTPPIGREATYVWPPYGVEPPAVAITDISVYREGR